MPSDELLADLVARLRGGEEAAAAELVRRRGPAVRREVRTWLRLQNLTPGDPLDAEAVGRFLLALAQNSVTAVIRPPASDSQRNGFRHE